MADQSSQWPRPSMRAGHADRERTVDVLKAGFAEGRLTQDEYNERMSKAYESRTYGELSALIADLPAGPLPSVAATGPPAIWNQSSPQRDSANPLAVAAIIVGLAFMTFMVLGILVAAILAAHGAPAQFPSGGG
jgi:Domain of unknown function (DUF1707)